MRFVLYLGFFFLSLKAFAYNGKTLDDESDMAKLAHTEELLIEFKGMTIPTRAIDEPDTGPWRSEPVAWGSRKQDYFADFFESNSSDEFRRIAIQGSKILKPGQQPGKNVPICILHIKKEHYYQMRVLKGVYRVKKNPTDKMIQVKGHKDAYEYAYLCGEREISVKLGEKDGVEFYGPKKVRNRNELFWALKGNGDAETAERYCYFRDPKEQRTHDVVKFRLRGNPPIHSMWCYKPRMVQKKKVYRDGVVFVDGDPWQGPEPEDVSSPITAWDVKAAFGRSGGGFSSHNWIKLYSKGPYEGGIYKGPSETPDSR